LIVESRIRRQCNPRLCKGRAHRRETLGFGGRRVLASRKWSGKMQLLTIDEVAAYLRVSVLTVRWL